MKTFSRVAIAALTMVGVAQAQTAPVPAPAPKTPAPAPAPAPKAPAPMPAPKAPAPAPVPPPVAKASPPPPHAEVAAMAKTTGGVWRCKGDELDHKGTRAPVTATSTIKLELDRAWLVETTEVKGRIPFKMVAYTSYDAAARKWRRLAFMNGGGHMIGTSDGLKENKLTWNLEMTTPMGAGLMREHVDLSDPKAGLKGRGEMSMDRGRTWLPVYEMTCRK